ncbi:MAG: M1 family metallopeptidase [Anaerolineae bacterium]|nr:M1 family metallopeptidase [Anaerolineae bacterium]
MPNSATQRIFTTGLGLALLVFAAACGNVAQAALQPAPTLSPTETAVPLATPTTAPAGPAIVLPAVDWAEVSIHRQAMKPEFASDVDDFVNANRYLIVARVALEPNGAGTDAVIRGAERVRYTNHSPDTLDSVVFRLYPNAPALGGRMTVSRVTVDGREAEPSLRALRSVMDVPLEEPLAPGESAEMTVDFTVVMSGGLNTSYGRFGFVNQVISATAWYPTLSVYEPGDGWWETLPSPQGDPAFTETGLYDVRLTLPADMTPAMSGVIVETTPNDDGTVTYRDVTGPMRDHAFQASARYMITPVEADDTRINIVHYRDRAALETDGTEDAAQFSADSVRAFNEAFGDYPYAELDVVMNPTPSGVEFPGLVQIAARAWTRGEPFLEIVIAHEIGHQWFYALVGNNQVEHPWLDEALTSYTEIVYLRYVDPTGQRAQQHIAGFERDYSRFTGSRQADLALDLPVRSFTGFAYGAIVYRKGPLFIVELERQLGQDMVQRALAAYVERFRYEVATSADVQAVFEEVSGDDLDAVFDEWVYRSR